MKKIFALALAIILLIGVLPSNAFAANEAGEVDVVCYEDGSCMEVSVEQSIARIANEVSGSKTYTFRDSDGNIEWVAKLSATYVFTGGSYTCTSASCTLTIYDNNWYQISKTTNYAGNRATANLTLGRKALGVTIEKPQYTINLYCDFYGNLS